MSVRAVDRSGSTLRLRGRPILTTLLALLISPLLPSCAHSEIGAPQPAFGAISGKVVSIKTGLGIPNASAIILNKARGAPTNRSGEFRIDHVPPGEQTLRIMMIGFRRVDRKVAVSPAETVSVGVIGLEEQAIRIVGTPDQSRPRYFDGTVGSLVRGAEKEIECVVRLLDPEPTVGDRLLIDVRLYNLSGIETVLPLGRPGCDEFGCAGAQYPKIWIEVAGPPEGFVVEPENRPAPGARLRLRDLPAVKSGDSFDPLRRGWRPKDLATGRFKKPGKYRVTVHYSTYESKVERWLEETNSESATALAQRLNRVPLVQVEDSVNFVVRR